MVVEFEVADHCGDLEGLQFDVVPEAGKERCVGGVASGGDPHKALSGCEPCGVHSPPLIVDKGFGNGRVARNLFEAAVARHASRVVTLESPTDDDLTTLMAHDIPDLDESADSAIRRTPPVGPAADAAGPSDPPTELLDPNGPGPIPPTT